MIFGLSDIVSREDVKEWDRPVKTRPVETLGRSFRKSLLLSFDIHITYLKFLISTVNMLTNEIGIKGYKKIVIRSETQFRKSEIASTFAEK